MKYVYIHGFNSGPESRSRAGLEKELQTEIICFQNDYSRPFEECLQKMRENIFSAVGLEKIRLFGASLGGFYALQLRLPNLERVVAWNPVVWPALQLKQFIGENSRFTDGAVWNFSESVCRSYARAADARQWANFHWFEESESMSEALRPKEAAPPRTIVLGDHDELLDSSLTRAYWRDHAPVLTVRGGHGIEDFSHVRGILNQE